MKSFLVSLGVALFTASLSAATLTPVSYSYGNAPGDPNDINNYYDTAFTKLTDGVDSVGAWGGAGAVDITAFAGWFYTGGAASITFNFGGNVSIDSVTLWAADSDDAAGVGLPVNVTLAGAGGFSQGFPITNPAGTGTTVPLVLSGFSYTGDSITLTIPANYQWLMLSEVTFTGASAVPEPSAYAALAGVAALGIVVWRRRNRA